MPHHEAEQDKGYNRPLTQLDGAWWHATRSVRPTFSREPYIADGHRIEGFASLPIFAS
jgi:hypothetical protein